MNNPQTRDGRDQFPLRLPEGMRERLKDAAAANNRTMNAEIVDRLEYVLPGGALDVELTELHGTIDRLSTSLAEHKADLLAVTKENFRLHADLTAMIGKVEQTEARLADAHGELRVTLARVDELRRNIDDADEMKAGMQEHIADLSNRVDAAETVGRAMAEAIDELVGEDPDFLVDSISSAFSNFDKPRLHRDWFEKVTRRLRDAMEGTFYLADDLLQRVKAKAEKENRSVEGEVLSTLEREYPAPSDVMHIHLANIREALSRYERATDPQERLRLQTLVEIMAGAGHNFEIEWEDDEP